jgi:hypothetical protein
MRQRLIWLAMAVAVAAPAFGGTIITVNLGSSSPFALLGSTISNTGISQVTGNVGATTTITDSGPWVVTGTVYPAGNSTAVAAYNAFENAYNTTLALSSTQPTLTSLPLTQTFTGNNVYTFTDDLSTATGTALTFDAQNNPNEVFVIQIDGTLTVNGILTFNLINGAQADNIFWVVADAATISAGSSPAQTFDGSILAGTSFTMSAQTGGSGVLAGTVNGCVFSETANTLAGETDVNGCSATTAATGGSSGVPEPRSAGLVSFAGLMGILAWRKVRSASILST